MLHYRRKILNTKRICLCREIARMLAHMKRVVVVDTSNEIGGDGDVPHSGIGRARRMQVPNVNMQHNVSLQSFLLLSSLLFTKFGWLLSIVIGFFSPNLFSYCAGHD